MQTPRTLPRPAARAACAATCLHPQRWFASIALLVSDLILPVFVLAGQGITQDVASMPGVQRMTLDRLLPVADECVAARHPADGAVPGDRCVR